MTLTEWRAGHLRMRKCPWGKGKGKGKEPKLNEIYI